MKRYFDDWFRLPTERQSFAWLSMSECAAVTSVRCALVIGLAGVLCRSAVAAEPAGRVTFAESDIVIIRNAVLYRAAVGTVVHDGDIIESRLGGAQVEFPGPIVMAVAPQSRLLVVTGNSSTVACSILVYSLHGMIKITQLAAASGKAVCVQAAQIRSIMSSGSLIQRFDGSAVSLFVERGDSDVRDLGAAVTSRSPVKVPAEQFAQWRAGQPLKVLGRPTAEFLAAMPPSFQDALTPMADKIRDVRVEPVAERQVSYDDVAEWLKAMPRRSEFVRQFQPRLKDPEFRRRLDADLGRSAPWGPLLHPTPSPSDTKPLTRGPRSPRDFTLG
jgi:hypothetical protein